MVLFRRWIASFSVQGPLYGDSPPSGGGTAGTEAGSAGFRVRIVDRNSLLFISIDPRGKDTGWYIRVARTVILPRKTVFAPCFSGFRPFFSAGKQRAAIEYVLYLG
jgi:hypothetical protein